MQDSETQCTPASPGARARTHALVSPLVQSMDLLLPKDCLHMTDIHSDDLSASYSLLEDSTADQPHGALDEASAAPAQVASRDAAADQQDTAAVVEAAAPVQEATAPATFSASAVQDVAEEEAEPLDDGSAVQVETPLRRPVTAAEPGLGAAGLLAGQAPSPILYTPGDDEEPAAGSDSDGAPDSEDYEFLARQLPQGECPDLQAELAAAALQAAGAAEDDQEGEPQWRHHHYQQARGGVLEAAFSDAAGLEQYDIGVLELQDEDIWQKLRCVGNAAWTAPPYLRHASLELCPCKHACYASADYLRIALHLRFLDTCSG